MRKPEMRVRAYAVLERAVGEGIVTGWRRAHKHTDKPSEQVVCEAIETAVMGEICEWFAFEEVG